MRPLRGESWKAYYSGERERRADELRDSVIEAWKVETDHGPRDVLEKGGALSFPHTYIDGSFEALLRTVRAVYRAEKRRVLALGVLHRGNNLTPHLEFSLDGFRFVAEMFSSELGLPPLEIQEEFLPLNGHVAEDQGEFIREHTDFGEKLKTCVDQDTAIVLTGDLSHFGWGYGSKEMLPDHERVIFEQVDVILGLLYRERNLPPFVDRSQERQSDQMANGMALSSLLEGNLDFRIFYQRLSDYGEILGSESPTVVASVFYGVWPQGR